ncbi:MAG: hypothetical protein M3383_03370 [Actinomycetota bacterium]|nr:hypothetical protein [Actinomycetota bacterium]
MRWLAASGVSVTVYLALAGSALGAGATFQVIQCDSLNRDKTAVPVGSSAYVTRNHCIKASGDFALKVENAHSVNPGQGRRWVWSAPEGLGIVGVRVQARLQRHQGHIPRLYMADARGEPTNRIATGDTDPDPFGAFTWRGPSQKRFVASLACEGGHRCLESDRAKTWVRNVRLEVVDLVDPELEVGGSVVSGGWLRGSQDLTVEATDVGSGMRRIQASVNAESVLDQRVPCNGVLDAPEIVVRLDPCPFRATGIHDIAAGEPWENGTNALVVCGFDLAGDRACASETVRVDNLPPSLAFTPQALEDPELIRAFVDDPHSGLASGTIFFRRTGTLAWRPLPTQKAADELRARVDSAAEEPGSYEFVVQATDVAGNSAATILREDGLPMVLQFPLRSGVKLTTRLGPGGGENQVVQYGRSLTSAGRLLSAAGQPLANQPVVVDEYFGDGALIDRRTRTVMTDENGRWESGNPAGPSRRITATYAGDARYLGTSERVGRMSVKTGARFGVRRDRVREGRKAVFKGRVRHVGARIPDRGKLVQLQYQDADSRRWSTVRNPFYTRADGRYRFAYEFGTHYVNNVGIRFRLRVLPETSWPYRSVKTRARRVVVEAR